jgi:hypothetical protein
VHPASVGLAFRSPNRSRARSRCRYRALTGDHWPSAIGEPAVNEANDAKLGPQGIDNEHEHDNEHDWKIRSPYHWHHHSLPRDGPADGGQRRGIVKYNGSILTIHAEVFPELWQIGRYRCRFHLVVEIL